MLDSASAVALLESLPPDRTVVTKRLIVDFENPAVPGTLIATARVTESAERSATVVAELRNADGVIVARARTELRIIAASR
jgi:acyl-coenzyme A thioesterase PaaI-like protein